MTIDQEAQFAILGIIVGLLALYISYNPGIV